MVWLAIVVSNASPAGLYVVDCVPPSEQVMLVTDCYSGYEAQHASVKQKCLAHLARTARDWQKLVAKHSSDFRFFDRVMQWVKTGCLYSQKQADWSDSMRRQHRQ